MDLKEVVNRDSPRHPWEICRLNFFTGLLATAMPAGLKPKILDVGAGDGWVGQGLSSAMAIEQKIVCWDINYTAEDLDRIETGPDSELEFVRDRPAGKFDLILMLDVLEHIENDEEFLGHLVAGNLDRDGFVVVSVPAWPILFSSHDRALDHFRRYRPGAARAILANTGLRILCSGGLFHSLILPRAVQVIGERWFQNTPKVTGVGAWRGGAITTNMIVAALSADNRISAFLPRTGISVPGLSWWALCQKNS